MHVISSGINSLLLGRILCNFSRFKKKPVEKMRTGWMVSRGGGGCVQPCGSLCQLSASVAESGSVLLVLNHILLTFLRGGSPEGRDCGREKHILFTALFSFSVCSLFCTLLFCMDSSLWGSWIRSCELFSWSGPRCSGTCTSPGTFRSSLQILNLHLEHQPLQIFLFKVLQWYYLGTNRGWIS